jgi:predicted nucleic acid binding AN1-type Zn finger protein
VTPAKTKPRHQSKRRSASQGTANIFNKIIAENFPNLETEMPIQLWDASRIPNRHNQNRTSPPHIIVKTISTENKVRILKAVREKNQITYKGKTVKITSDFSTEILKERRAYFEHSENTILILEYSNPKSYLSKLKEE